MRERLSRLQRWKLERLRVEGAPLASELAASGIDPSDRPRTRADCQPGGMNAERPCPWIGCRHSNYLEIGLGGGISFNHPDLEPWEMTHSCSLDVAEEGGMTLEELGKRLNLTRERARQIEARAIGHLRDALPGSGL